MKSILSDRVRVLIFGREYEFDAGGLTPLEVQSLAAFVDERMREISNDLSLVDTQKIAVLAAVNIAHDYLQLRDKGQGKGEDVSLQLESLEQILSHALKS